MSETTQVNEYWEKYYLIVGGVPSSWTCFQLRDLFKQVTERIWVEGGLQTNNAGSEPVVQVATITVNGRRDAKKLYAALERYRTNDSRRLSIHVFDISNEEEAFHVHCNCSLLAMDEDTHALNLEKYMAATAREKIQVEAEALARASANALWMRRYLLHSLPPSSPQPVVYSSPPRPVEQPEAFPRVKIPLAVSQAAAPTTDPRQGASVKTGSQTLSKEPPKVHSKELPITTTKELSKSTSKEHSKAPSTVKPPAKSKNAWVAEKALKKQRKQTHHIVHLSNLNFTATEQDLKKLFVDEGLHPGLIKINRKAKGKSKGYAKVVLPTSDEATIAATRLDNAEFMDRLVKVTKYVGRAFWNEEPSVQTDQSPDSQSDSETTDGDKSSPDPDIYKRTPPIVNGSYTGVIYRLRSLSLS